MATAEFNTDLEYANTRRLRLDKYFYPQMSLEGRFVPLDRSPGSIYIQREIHVDCVVASHAGGSVTVEEKIVRWKGYHYTAITIETHSNLSRRADDEIGDGWIATSKADFLLYAFEQPNKSLKVWVFDLPKLRDWFTPRVNQYRITDTDNGFYTTRCRIVPLVDIPKHIIRVRAKAA